MKNTPKQIIRKLGQKILKGQKIHLAEKFTKYPKVVIMIRETIFRLDISVYNSKCPFSHLVTVLDIGLRNEAPTV